MHFNTENLALGQLTSMVLPTRLLETKVTRFECDSTFDIQCTFRLRVSETHF